MTEKKVAILQSNYIPWKGYFDIIGLVDEFIFHDDLQYTKNDWRNRNKIKTDTGTRWLTIPCGTDEHRLICDVVLKDASWQKQHWNIISQYYRKAPFFRTYKDFFEHFYLGEKHTNLSDMNQGLIKNISTQILGLKTTFKDSRTFNLQTHKAQRVLELLKKTGATYYLSGPAAQSYINPNDFATENIQLEWMDYSNYSQYPQLYPPFEHAVSILDLIFNCGPDAIKFMKANKCR